MPLGSMLVVENAGIPGILSPVSVSVAQGTFLALLGPNGAGKTSLMQLMAGRNASAGHVSIAGQSLRALDPRRRARLVAHVAQRDDPDPHFVVRDYVSLGRLPHQGTIHARSDAAAIAAALERCGVASLAGRTLGCLSGGELQRVRLARAVAQDTPVLLLDEPTNHLDPAAATGFLRTVRTLGRTVVAVLHDLASADAFADRVLLLRGGRTVAEGTPGECLHSALVRDVFGLDCARLHAPDGTRHFVLMPAG